MTCFSKFLGASAVSLLLSRASGEGNVILDSSLFPLKPNTAVITCASAGFGEGRVTVSQPEGAVLGVIDIRDPGCDAPDLGTPIQNWDSAAMYHNEFAGPTKVWTYGNFGHEIMGSTLDNEPNPNIYVLPTVIYNGFQLQPTAPQEVWKVDGTTGDRSVLTTLWTAGVAGSTKDLGLGSICYHRLFKQLYVTSFADGWIYRLDAVTGAVLSHYDPFLPYGDATRPDDTTHRRQGMVHKDERIWGIQVLYEESGESFVYFGTWKNDFLQNNRDYDQVWSIKLDGSGDFLTGADDVKLEVDMSITNSRREPISDIAFSALGDMLVAERTMTKSFPAHRSNIYRFNRDATGTWQVNPSQYDVGQLASGFNSAGGVDFADCVEPNDCNPYNLTVVSADAIRFQPSHRLYGIQILPADGGGLSNSWAVDFDNEYQDHPLFGSAVDKMWNGNVEVVRSCAGASLCVNNGGDTDGDLICDDVDNCIDNVNVDQANGDGDEYGDACDNCVDVANDQSNEDGDAYGDACDNCVGLENDDQANADDDLFGDACDNCVDVANDNQANADGDIYGDACDNCVNVANDDQANADDDMYGDACDNCVDVPNDQANADGDMYGDACDNCVDVPNDQANADGDMYGDACDNCVNIANNDQTNADDDMYGDACDNCVNVANDDQANTDGDMYGDACDNCANVVNNDQANADDDMYGDACDNCVNVANDDQANADGDIYGDACDNCVNVANDDQANADDDMYGDACDNCVDVPNDQSDADNDMIGDACDICPFDPENDIDGDGVCGDVDNCPYQFNPDQMDTDRDGYGDVCDRCPYDFSKFDDSNPADIGGPCGCQNTAAYSGVDTGCSSSAPICVGMSNVEPAFHTEGVSCVPCVNNQQSTAPNGWPDNGCSSSEPLCLYGNDAEPTLLTSGTYCSPNNFVCFNTEPHGGLDKDCGAETPICVGEGGKQIDHWCYGAECVKCVNSYVDNSIFVDFGCSADAPRCALGTEMMPIEPSIMKPGSICVGSD